MITENLRDITDINMDLLPPVIKNEFEKIRFLFNTKQNGIRYLKYFFNNVYADTPLVLSIKELDKRIKFNKNIEDSIDSYDEGYDDGTCTTYIFEGRTKEEEQIFEVFQGVFNKLPSIQQSGILQFKKNIPHYNDLGFLSYQFEKYGRETGIFITNWTIILNNANLFEDIFNSHFTKNKKPMIENNLVSTIQQLKIALLDTPESSGSGNGAIVINEEHGEVFTKNGFKLFEHILNQYVKPNRGRLRDIHYFYWAMFKHKNKYIHQRPEPFKEWFFKTYNEDLGQIKTFQIVQNPDRDKHFSNALDWFKTQNR